MNKTPLNTLETYLEHFLEYVLSHFCINNNFTVLILQMNSITKDIAKLQPLMNELRKKKIIIRILGDEKNQLMNLNVFLFKKGWIYYVI